MATRNKTATFIKFRDAVRRSQPSLNPEVTNGFVPEVSKGGYIRLELTERGLPESSLPPLWVDLSDRIKDEMQKIRLKLAELSKLQAKALLPNFDNSRSPHEENIENLTHEITLSLKRCEKDLMRLTKDYGGGKENESVCRNVQRSMATDLQSLSMDFRRMSKTYLKRLEEQRDHTSTSRSKKPYSKESHDLESGGEDSGFTDSQAFRVKQMEALSVDREKEVNEILASVNDLAQMMKDLSALVIDQGTVVDRIDYNVQNVSDTVDKGVKQLVKAERSQKRNALISCILLLLVVCVVLLAVLLVKSTIF